MRSVLLAVVVALCAVLAPAVTPVAIGAPPPKSKTTSVPKEEAPREEREPSRLRMLAAAAAVERASAMERPRVVAFAPRSESKRVVLDAAEPMTVWRTPPALQVFRN